MIRIVKMTFQHDRADDFLGIFNEIKGFIENFEGCTELRLLRDNEKQNIFFTYSVWDNAEALERYRTSEFFKEIWSRAKVNFSERAEAWSLDEAS